MSFMNFFSSAISNINVSMGDSLLQQPSSFCNLGMTIPEVPTFSDGKIDTFTDVKPSTTILSNGSNLSKMRMVKVNKNDICHKCCETLEWIYGETENEANWVCTNTETGKTYYGFDRGDGYTDWYDESGNYEYCTDTPDYEGDYY